MHLYQPLCHSSKACKEWFHCEVCDYDFQKETKHTQNNFVSVLITCKSIIGIVFFNPRRPFTSKNIIFCVNGLRRLKKMIPMILLHVMTTLTKLFCVPLASFFNHFWVVLHWSLFIIILRNRLGVHITTLWASSSHARVSLESSSSISVKPFMSRKNNKTCWFCTQPVKAV